MRLSWMHGKRNDQVRFELTTRYLSPELQVIAPVREWEFKSREDEIEYAKNIISLPVTKRSHTVLTEPMGNIYRMRKT